MFIAIREYWKNLFSCCKNSRRKVQHWELQTSPLISTFVYIWHSLFSSEQQRWNPFKDFFHVFNREWCGNTVNFPWRATAVSKFHRSCRQCCIFPLWSFPCRYGSQLYFPICIPFPMKPWLPSLSLPLFSVGRRWLLLRGVFWWCTEGLESTCRNLFFRWLLLRDLCRWGPLFGFSIWRWAILETIIFTSIYNIAISIESHLL